MTTGVMLDLHGTLLDSNVAWVGAFREIDPRNAEYYERGIWQGRSRRALAEDANVSFERLKDKYRSKLRPRTMVVEFVNLLARDYPLIIVSNAERQDILEDVRILPKLPVQRIYSREDGTKPDRDYLERICREMAWDRAFLLGNNPVEDYIWTETIMSIIVPYPQP